MPKLKHTIETIICVEYGDLEKLIREVYGRSFSIPADLECENGTSVEYHLSREPLDTYDQERIARWRSNDLWLQFMTRPLLQDMVNQEVISPGDYLIKVSW